MCQPGCKSHPLCTHEFALVVQLRGGLREWQVAAGVYGFFSHRTRARKDERSGSQCRALHQQPAGKFYTSKPDAGRPAKGCVTRKLAEV